MRTISAGEKVFCLIEVDKREGDSTVTFRVKEGEVKNHWWVDSSLFYDVDISGNRVGMPKMFVFMEYKDAIGKARELGQA